MTIAIRVTCCVVAAGLIVNWPLLAGAQTDDGFLLSPGKAGRIEVGQALDELYRLVGRDRVRLIDLYREGMFDPAVEIRLPGSSTEPAIVAPIREWPCPTHSIQGLNVRDARFRTKEGLGVGSTLAELQKHYRVVLSDEEGPHAWVEAIQMNFGLENGSRLPSVRVRSVWLPGNPVAIRRARCPERGPFGREPR